MNVSGTVSTVTKEGSIQHCCCYSCIGTIDAGTVTSMTCSLFYFVGFLLWCVNKQIGYSIETSFFLCTACGSSIMIRHFGIEKHEPQP